MAFHEGLGLGEFAMERARRLAGLGYVALAADMFGDRRQASNSGGSRRRSSAGFAPSRKSSARGRVALETLASLPQVDARQAGGDRVLLGGSVVLGSCARGRRPEGGRQFPRRAGNQNAGAAGLVKASVLVCTGVASPAPPEQVADFENEMRTGGVKDWQVIAYGNTLHGFTNPAADGSMMRTALYNEQADRRSWASMKSLFDEVLT